MGQLILFKYTVCDMNKARCHYSVLYFYMPDHVQFVNTAQTIQWDETSTF